MKQFADAEAIVPPHGPGLVNMIFSPNCEVFELISGNLVFPFYQCVAGHLGHEYEYLYADRENDDSKVDVHQFDSRLQKLFT